MRDASYWETCDDPEALLQLLGAKVDKRKLRLFACACCRGIWEHMRPKSRAAVEAAEAYADKQIKRADLVAVRAAALKYVRNSADTPAAFAVSSVAHPNLSAKWVAYLCRRATWPVHMESWDWVNELEGGKQAALLRDIIENPFRPGTFDSSWRTSTASDLASAIYEERAFDRMPILADALEEAGCDNPDILSHCRSDGPHVRGCWVVDLVLGKN